MRTGQKNWFKRPQGGAKVLSKQKYIYDARSPFSQFYHISQKKKVVDLKDCFSVELYSFIFSGSFIRFFRRDGYVTDACLHNLGPVLQYV